jgi:hypothetical protein
MTASKHKFVRCRIGFLLAFGLSLGLAGCGGEDQGRVKADSNVIPDDSLIGCDLAATLEQTLVLRGDFENQTATSWKAEPDKSTAAADRVCSQDSRKDCSEEETDSSLMINMGTGTLRTGAYGAFGEDDPPAPPDCVVGTRGLHVRSKGLDDWGGKVVRDYTNDTPPAFDASGFAGISFWARKYSEDVGGSLFVAFDDKYTRENQSYVDENGITRQYCLDSPIDTDKCDRFGIGIGLETTWRFYKIPFSELKQRGYGVKSDKLHTDEILAISFGFDVGDWDFWLDQVSYYKEKE